MKNMNPDSRIPFAEYNDAVNRKKNEDEKNELNSLKESIRLCYDNYKSHFDENNLEFLLPERSFTPYHQGLLRGLYNYNSKFIKDFRRRFVCSNSGAYENLCPYCTINQSNTIEHILPKEQYPEYAIHINNLIPACSQCNSYKGEYIVDEHNQRFTLNFYQDKIPNVQFLFVDIVRKGDYIDLNYKLDNSSLEIDEELFALLKRHYERMHLVGKDSRLNSKARNIFQEIVNEYLVQEFKNDEQYANFAEKQKRKCDMDAVALGINHWRLVLYKSIACSSIFKDFIFRKK